MLTTRLFGRRSPAPDRRTYQLAFPSELDEERVAAWVRSISGTLQPAALGLGGSPTIVFELWATHEGLTHRVKVPWQHARYVVAQLRSLVPGIRVTPDSDCPQESWTRAVEVGLRGKHLPLRIVSAADIATSLLASVQTLSKGETIIVQWVVTPAIPMRPPAQPQARHRESRLSHFASGRPADRDEITERRSKLEDQNLLAVLRVGAVAKTPSRADQLIYGVRAALASSRGHSSRFVKRFVSATSLQRRIAEATAPLTFPIRLSVPELAALIAWPIGEPHVAGLPQARSRHLPPSGVIAQEGLVVARSNFPGAERPLAVAGADVCKHLHIVGPTGVGKTALAGNLAAQAMATGSAVIVMESKGDLFHAALDSIPKRRLGDVIIVDVSDSHPVGYNLLSEGNPRIAVEELCQLFEYLYPDMRRGIWARAALHRGLSTLITRQGAAFVDLVPLLSPTSRSDSEQQWRDELIAGVSDPELARFWERFDALSQPQQETYAAPILDRVWQLNERPEIRHIIGQSQSSFSMREAIQGRRILLINLAGLGVETARLAGTLFLNAIWSAVRGGASNPKKPTFLVLDEFQDFLNLPVDPETLLVRSRSYGLAMVLAHQHLDQLPASIRSAVLANARSKVVFQTAADDARVFAREFGKQLSEDDFMNLGQYEVLCRLATGEGVSAPVTGVTLPPQRPSGLAAEVRTRSRERYGRAPADIEADIAGRRKPTTAPRTKRPRLGRTSWDA